MLNPLLRILIAFVLKLVEALCSLLVVINNWKIPQKCPPVTNKIIFHPACVLAEKIRKKQLKSETVIKAYISRIKEVNPVLNAVVEDRFLLAENEARQIDEFISSTKLCPEELASKFPLLGLPLTVKESIAVEGLSHCSGTTFLDGNKATQDAEVVRLCKKAGAIPLLVSNTPEFCMNFETSNKITGTTCNPYDTRRTPGGSSGGEAALLGSGASLIGIGSDLGGSIRLPSHFCGIWGHKPSPGAVNNQDHYPNCKDKIQWKQVFHLGPMTRYAVDLPLLYNVILEKDSNTLLQLNKQVHIKNLNFYYIENNSGSILTHPIEKDIINGLNKLVAHLTLNCSCKVQKIQLNELQYSTDLSFVKIFSIDNIDNPFGNNGEGSFQELIRFATCRSKFTIQPILYGIIKRFTSWYLQKTTISQYNKNISDLKNKLCEILRDDGVLLYPCHPTAAGFHGQSNGKISDYSYTAIFNCLGLPVTSCPLGLNTDGLPIGIQVIAAPNNDRLTIVVAQEIEKSLGGWIPPPFYN